MEKAIQKAIEGGYQPHIYESSDSHYSDVWLGISGFDILVPEVLNDVRFWQCLARAEGWEIKSHMAYAIAYAMMARTGKTSKPRYLKEWHKFIDHIADCGNVDDFFNNLLK